MIILISQLLIKKKYLFLIKEFDSKDKGFEYSVQIYKIDFNKYFELETLK